MDLDERPVDLVCFGELIWDILPTGKVAGGAPFNIANRANALGLNVAFVGSLGNDDLGSEFLSLIYEKGISSKYIQQHSTLPTSVVNVTLDNTGEPQYSFLQPVAWDDIQWTQELEELVQKSRSIVYSSLALRDVRTKTTLFNLLPKSNLRICDVNLREGQYDNGTILQMIKYADILRMNEFELAQLVKWHGYRHLNIRSQMEALQAEYGYECVIATLGSDGAVAIQNGRWFQQSVFKVDVVDTVGSGDAFLASFIYKYLDGAEMSETLRFACAVGALTASKKGGTPEISKEAIEMMLEV